MNNKSVFLIVISILFFSFNFQYAFAHPGRTDSYGCHTCRTNCYKWGLSYGEYHCHRSKGLPQPKRPIRSHKGNPGTTEHWPEYEKPKIKKETKKAKANKEVKPVPSPLKIPDLTNTKSEFTGDAVNNEKDKNSVISDLLNLLLALFRLL